MCLCTDVHDMCILLLQWTTLTGFVMWLGKTGQCSRCRACAGTCTPLAEVYMCMYTVCTCTYGGHRAQTGVLGLALASFPGRKNEWPGTHCTHFNTHARSINYSNTVGIWKHTRSKYTKAIKVCCL